MKKISRRSFLTCAAAGIAMAGLSACGSAPAASSAASAAASSAAASGAASVNSSASGKVMMYSSMQEDQLVAIKAAFEKKYPSVQMEYYFAGTSKVITKIATEAQAGQVDADVIWVGDPADYVSFKEENILQPYTSTEVDAIDPAFVDPEGYYTGARMMNMGIGYNTTMVKPEEAPQSWTELLDEKWKGQIVMTDPGSFGTSKYWMNALMCSTSYGSDYMQKLKDNGCFLESGTTACHNQLAACAYKVGVCLDYVTANLAAEGSPLGFVYPTDTVSIFSPLGLVANCANADNGKLLYDFILSKEGQEVLIANNLISVRTDVDQGATDVAGIAKKALATDLATMASKAEENLAAFDAIYGI